MISTHTYTATLSNTTTTTPIVGGVIRLDDGSSPHVTADITIPMPGAWSEVESLDYFSDGFGEDPFGDGTFGSVLMTPSRSIDAALLEKYDPRKSLRVAIQAQVTTPTYTHTRNFNLSLRDRTISHADGTIRLTLASDESLLSDFAPLQDDTGPVDRHKSLRQIVAYVIRRVIPGAQINYTDTLDHSFADSDFDADALVWKAGQNALDFLVPLVQSVGYRIVCDELRGWTLRGGEYSAGGNIDVQHGVNLLDGTDAVARDSANWFDAMVTRYVWTDRDGVQQERIDSYSLRSAYTRLYTLEKSTPYPGAGFSSYAVRRAQARGRELSATVVADWRAHAEMPVTVQLEAAPIQTGRISSLSFDMDRDEMTIIARTITTPLSAYKFIPRPTPWTAWSGKTWAQRKVA